MPKLIVGLLIITSVASAGSAVPSGEIHACYALKGGEGGEKNGPLRIVNAPSDCKQKEVALSWNQRGETGPMGADGLHCWDLDGNGRPSPEEDVTKDNVLDALDCQGADGAPGEQGTPGTAGQPGAEGAAGAIGATGAQGPEGPRGPPGLMGPMGPAGPHTIDGLPCSFAGASGSLLTVVDAGLRFKAFCIIPGLNDPFTFYLDRDQDSWGDAARSILSPEPVDGFVGEAGDCDDGDPDVHPGTVDLLDGVDSDCDGSTDEDEPAPPTGGTFGVTINEFDYQQPGLDEAEFVELYNPTDSHFAFAGGALAFYDEGQFVGGFALGDLVIAPGSFYVAELPAGALRNAGSVIAVYSHDIVLDTVQYGSAVALAEGSDVAQSLGRCPDGFDTQVDGSDFFLMMPTPGSANRCSDEAPEPMDPCATVPNVGPNAMATCDDGGWTFTCASGYEQLDNDWENGCETTEAPTISFASPSSTMSWGPPLTWTTHRIDVRLSGPASGDIVVPFTLSDANVGPAAGFRFPGGPSITIPAGQSGGQITFESVRNQERAPPASFDIIIQVSNPGPYVQHTVTFQESDCQPSNEVESNGSPATASLLQASGSMPSWVGQLCGAGDRDWFRLELPPDWQSVEITVLRAPVPEGPETLRVTIWDAATGRILGTTDGSQPFYDWVGADNMVGPNGVYYLEITAGLGAQGQLRPDEGRYGITVNQ